MDNTVKVKHSKKYAVVQYLQNNSVDFSLDEGSSEVTITIHEENQRDLEEIIDNIEDLNIG